MLNQARLKVLKVREDHVRNVLDEARKRLGEVTQDISQYREILKLLIIQGLFQVQDYLYLKLNFLFTTFNLIFIHFFIL